MSNLVASMSVEELRSFCRILDGINLELLNRPAFSTVGQPNNVVYFTREQFVADFASPFRR